MSHSRAPISRVRLKKKILGRTGATSCSSEGEKKKKSLQLCCGQQQKHIMPLSWCKPIRDSQGRSLSDAHAHGKMLRY